jgi:hypothetical protein
MCSFQNPCVSISRQSINSQDHASLSVGDTNHTVLRSAIDIKSDNMLIPRRWPIRDSPFFMHLEKSAAVQ